MEGGGAAVLTFDNVRPPRRALDDLLAGKVRMQVFDAAGSNLAVVGLSLLADSAEEPSSA